VEGARDGLRDGWVLRRGRRRLLTFGGQGHPRGTALQPPSLHGRAAREPAAGAGGAGAGRARGRGCGRAAGGQHAVPLPV
jgi:hypothetical protein